MSGPSKWSLEGEAPEPGELDEASAVDQNRLAYDERGNVRPADDRFPNEEKAPAEDGEPQPVSTEDTKAQAESAEDAKAKAVSTEDTSALAEPKRRTSRNRDSS